MSFKEGLAQLPRVAIKSDTDRAAALSVLQRLAALDVPCDDAAFECLPNALALLAAMPESDPKLCGEVLGSALALVQRVAECHRRALVLHARPCIAAMMALLAWLPPGSRWPSLEIIEAAAMEARGGSEFTALLVDAGIPALALACVGDASDLRDCFQATTLLAVVLKGSFEKPDPKNSQFVDLVCRVGRFGEKLYAV